MNEIELNLLIAERTLELEKNKYKLKKLIKNEANLEEIIEKFTQQEKKLNDECEEKLAKLRVLISDDRHKKLTQSVYRYMKSKCNSSKYKKALYDLKSGKAKVKAKYEENEEKIEEAKRKIKSLEKEIANLRNSLANLR